jgi:hypothetical protein
MENRKPANPFEYEAAVKFATDELIEYFVEDHNYSRFIQSSRNVFLVGERGCGKSMTLLYNSFQKQLYKTEKEGGIFDFSRIGIYIPCMNTLFFKEEYALVENPFKVAVLSEHIFVLAIAYGLVSELATIDDRSIKEDEEKIKESLDYALNIKIPNGLSLFHGLALYFQKLTTETQDQINNSEDNTSDKCVSFYSLIIPLLRIIKSTNKFKDTHFLFLIDDAQDLNIHQIKALNSWIAYRDHVNFSFKVAIAKVRKHSYSTANGSSIIEGHDFLKIDMEKPYQNKFSDFGLWAKDIVERRLEKFRIGEISAEKFFPLNPLVEKELEMCKEKVREKAEKIYEEAENKSKKISDYIYKYARAEYFKSRKPQANLPQYSGWDTIVNLSTGVIRNLLLPCWWMYDKEFSKLNSTDKNITEISPKNQDEVIKEKSQELWNRIDNDLFNNIRNCSTEQAMQIKNLFEKLVELFIERLHSDMSEPRAITFTISARNELSKEKNEELDELLRISKEAQILYDRISSSKELGERETYYVPNRLLFPIRGLDVVGQHARVSIKAVELYSAAKECRKINSKEIVQQKTLFDYEN